MCVGLASRATGVCKLAALRSGAWPFRCVTLPPPPQALMQQVRSECHGCQPCREFAGFIAEVRTIVLELKGAGCTHACMHACMHARAHPCMHTYMYGDMHACMHGDMHACMHARTHAHTHAHINSCAYICTCILIHIHVYTHIHV